MTQNKSRKTFRAINGIILLDKPLGLSSNQALQKVRFLFQAAKAGHTGSLDPQATGMLPICLGEASKVSAFLLDASKGYLTKARLGQTSTTGDCEGELSLPKAIPTLDTSLLATLLARFRGEIQQIPPMYSALKKAGKPLYELARQGITVERPARSVTIHQLQLLNFTLNELELAVHCSKGTYIRTLVEDLGAALGCGAYVTRLHRTVVEPFGDYPMYTLAQLQLLAEQSGLQGLDQLLLPIDSALPHLPALSLSTVQTNTLGYGQEQAVAIADMPLIKLYDPQHQFIGLGYVQSGVLRPKRLMARIQTR